MSGAKLIDPDCRDGKHRSCVGGLCECSCHWTDHSEPPELVDTCDNPHCDRQATVTIQLFGRPVSRACEVCWSAMTQEQP